MKDILCPTCGNPVMVKGNRWECGWCCDFGSIESLLPSEKAKLYEDDSSDELSFTLKVTVKEEPPRKFSRAELEDMVRRWDLSEHDAACEDLLIAAFPEATSRWSAKELSDMLVMDILLKTNARDPDTAFLMMKLLLDTAEESLSEPSVAKDLFAWHLHDLIVNDTMLPILLEELKWDDRLVCQFFLSAYVGDIQEHILDACIEQGETELHQKLLDILTSNAYYEE